MRLAVSRLAPFLVLVLSQAIIAHPFDQVRADSSSYFIVNENSVQFRLKFPVHAYVNLYVKSRKQYDTYAGKIETKKEILKLREYIRKHILVFDGKNGLKLTLEKLAFERDAYLSDQRPQYVVARGTFRQKNSISEIYIFNDLFKEGKAPHLGDSEIEVKDQVYDFQFKERRYFRLKIKK